MRRLAILVHEHDAFESQPYFLRECVSLWRAQGTEVNVMHGPKPPNGADLGFLHVDLTVVPPPYLEACRAFPHVLNGRVADISKRVVSRNLVRRGDGYVGPVIIKTNLNHGGKMEALRAPEPDSARVAARGLRSLLPWNRIKRRGGLAYRIVDSVREVPDAVWDRRDLVVERFLPERSGRYYIQRSWIFLGDRELVTVWYSKKPIVKARNIARYEHADGVPDELRRVRCEMGFDFGKFDYVMIDGKPVLFDANRTPILGLFTRPENAHCLRHLADGIRAF